MTEENIEQLLTKWSVPEDVIINFTENGITIKQLPQLDDNFLKELCPRIGTRIDLKTKINEYLVSTTNTVSVSSIDTITDQDDDLPDLGDILASDLYVRPEFPDFDLRTLLTTTPCGPSIINFYAKSNNLTNKHRNQLTDIIIRHLFTRIVNHKITYEEYNLITAKIIALFPSENTGTYFVPPIKKRQSISGKPSVARGKLVDKVRNVLYRSGEKRKLINTDENIDSSKKNKFDELKEDHADELLFLKNNTEPWSRIIECWLATYELRKQSSSSNIASFIEEWNILNDPRGDSLINLDFEKQYPERTSSFYKNWKWFINKIISIKFDSKDETVTTLNEKIQQLPDDDQKLPEEVKLLSYLIPPRGRLTKHSKFSTLECIESFIIEVQNPGDIKQKIEDVKEKALLHKKTVQPYLIKCGSDADDEKYYLIIDKVRYKLNSASKAFDTLFKTYHALHATYPPAGAHLYLLIQRCVYNIKTRYDKVVPYIADLMNLSANE